MERRGDKRPERDFPPDQRADGADPEETPGPPAGPNNRKNVPPPPQPRMPSLRDYLLWMLMLVAFSLYWSTTSEQAEELSYSDFKQRVRDGQVVSVTLQGSNASGRLVSDIEGGAALQDAAAEPSFTTTLPPIDDPELLPLLEAQGVEVVAKSEQTSWWMQVLLALLPWVLLVTLFWYLSANMRRNAGGTSGGLFGYGKSKAKRFRRSESSVSFGDVAGLDNAKRDLREVTLYLQDPAHFRRLGAKVPRGILLMGPPGTGKTLLAKAMAGEAGVPFFSISGSEFIEMFVGVGASRVRDLFDSAKAESPSIIFIDEIDSVGRARGTGLGGGHDEREQTLNQILGEMDGFDPHEAVVVLAATNRPDVLDTALLRPGRFDRKIVLDLPDRRARRAILDIHSRDVPLGEDVDLERIAALTVGFSGADLENLINEAALMAGRTGMTALDMDSLLQARDKVVLGARRELVIRDEEKRLVAYHEAGHALAASLLPQADRLDKVTIIPRGHALGATQQIPEEDRYNLREGYLRDRLGVMLGGRAAERVVFDELSSGAEDDLKQATQLARHMVTHWGMSEEVGPVAFRRGEEHIFLGREMTQQRDFSEHTARIIDQEISKLICGIEEKTIDLLTGHRRQLDALAEALLERETLSGDEIHRIIEAPGNKVLASASEVSEET